MGYQSRKIDKKDEFYNIQINQLNKKSYDL